MLAQPRQKDHFDGRPVKMRIDERRWREAVENGVACKPITIEPAHHPAEALQHFTHFVRPQRRHVCRAFFVCRGFFVAHRTT